MLFEQLMTLHKLRFYSGTFNSYHVLFSNVIVVFHIQDVFEENVLKYRNMREIFQVTVETVYILLFLFDYSPYRGSTVPWREGRTSSS